MACLFSMADAYKASFMASIVAKYEKAGEENGHYLAGKEWEAMKRENEFFGNTGTFYGTGEEFLARLSAKMRDMERELAERTGKPAWAIRRDVDKFLASA